MRRVYSVNEVAIERLSRRRRAVRRVRRSRQQPSVPQLSASK